MKYINFKRNKFLTTLKNSNFVRYIFSKFYEYVDVISFNLERFFKRLINSGYKIRTVIKYFNIIRLELLKKIKKSKFFDNKYVTNYLPPFILVCVLLYLSIPIFYNYDKNKITQVICDDKNINCKIEGKVNYSFFPTPRIKISNLTINSLGKDEKNLANINNTIIKISIFHLLDKKKQKYKSINLNNFEINVDLNNYKVYKNIFNNGKNYPLITFNNGKVVFFDKENYVSTIKDTNINIISTKGFKDIELKGIFLNESIFVSLNKKKEGDLPSTDAILKIKNLDLLVKTNFFNNQESKEIKDGNILIKKNKQRFTGVFNYKNGKITLNKSNLKNPYLKGTLVGSISFSPYFNFNLDLNLSSINFTKLYNYVLALDEIKQKNLFDINKKINGNLNFSSNKIYSSYNLVKSFESRLKFNNGNFIVEQFLFNLGKLGAADISGTIASDKKYTNFKYESNIFVDNQKKFLSKFGIYNKKTIPSNLFISGNLDLKNFKSTFYEISHSKKLKEDEINFIEDEFNEIVLKNGYENLFHFPKFNEFLKSVTSDVN